MIFAFFFFFFFFFQLLSRSALVFGDATIVMYCFYGRKFLMLILLALQWFWGGEGVGT
jgi:hypothetical protein